MLVRLLFHVLFWPRRRTWNQLRRFASTVPIGAKVLEIGSGRPTSGGFAYSVQQFFGHTEFACSDIDPSFGHQVVDVADMGFDDEYDVVLCVNVLEHIFDYRAAVENLRRAVIPRGPVFAMVPFLFPLHDEPGDF